MEFAKWFFIKYFLNHCSQFEKYEYLLINYKKFDTYISQRKTNFIPNISYE